MNLVDPEGQEEVRYIDKDGNRVIETNVIVVTRAIKANDANYSDRKRNRIEKQNQIIINENTTRVEQVRTALTTVFGDAIDEDGTKSTLYSTSLRLGKILSRSLKE